MANWHSMEVEEVLKKLNTDPDRGLNYEEVRKRLGKFGYNLIKKEVTRRHGFWSVSNILILTLLLSIIFFVIISLIFRGAIRLSEIFKHDELAFIF